MPSTCSPRSHGSADREAAPFDVEIVDSWMFVYSATVFDLRNPAAHQRILRIVDTVGANALAHRPVRR